LPLPKNRGIFLLIQNNKKAEHCSAFLHLNI
jgi:hypothetical protein